MRPLVEEVEEAEAKEIIRRLGLGERVPLPGLLGRLQGEVEARCRNEDGSVAWEVKQKNLVTDNALRKFASGWSATSNIITWTSSVYIFLSPSTEPPVAGRYTLPDDGSGIGMVLSSGIGMNPSYNASTLTWTLSYTFSGGNRQIATIGLGGAPSAANGKYGPVATIWAYTLLSPVKVQTSSQTVETVYRVTLIPSY